MTTKKGKVIEVDCNNKYCLWNAFDQCCPESPEDMENATPNELDCPSSLRVDFKEQLQLLVDEIESLLQKRNFSQLNEVLKFIRNQDEVETCNFCQKEYNPTITGGIVSGHPFCQECVVGMANDSVEISTFVNEHVKEKICDFWMVDKDKDGNYQQLCTHKSNQFDGVCTININACPVIEEKFLKKRRIIPNLGIERKEMNERG